MYYNRKIETMAREDMKKLQAERLRKTVERVYNNVPLYRNRFDEYGIKPDHIKSIDDLKNLPFTYKTDLRDTYPYGLFAAPMSEVVRIHASSGTTGKQTEVFKEKLNTCVCTDGRIRTGFHPVFYFSNNRYFRMNNIQGQG